MNKHQCMAIYTPKLQLVCDYIQRHLDEDLKENDVKKILFTTVMALFSANLVAAPFTLIATEKD